MKTKITHLFILILAIFMLPNIVNGQLLTESFEGTFPPTDWLITNNGTGNDWVQNTTLAYSSDGTNSMKYSYNLSDDADTWAFTKSVALTSGVTYQMTFDYKVRSATFAEKLKVTIGDAQTVASQATVLWDNNGGTSLSNEVFAEAVITYTATSTGTFYFAFNCYSDANKFALYVDNIVFGLQPTCPKPTNKIVTDVTANTAQLNWTSGGANNYNVEYGVAGFIQGAGTLVSVTDTFTMISGLSADTEYDWYVQDSCGVDDVSFWVGGNDFTTLVSCPAPSSQVVTDVSITTAQLNWNSGGSSNYNIEYGVDGFTQGTGTMVSSTDTFVVISALSADTQYDWYVQDSCGTGDASVWVGADDFTTPPACLAPSNQMVTATTSTTVQLNWTSGGSSNFNIEYGVDGFTQGTGTMVSVVTDTFVVISGLTSGTTYEWYVQDSCGVGNSSAWISDDFITVFGLPYYQDFDVYVPVGWMEKTGRLETSSVLTGTSSGWKTGNFVNTGTNKAAKINNYGTSRKDWLISPSIDLGSGASNSLNFDVALTNWNSSLADEMGVDDTLAVVISLDNGLTWDKSNIIKVWTGATINPSTSGDNINVDLSAYSSIVKIGFYASSIISNKDYDFHIDNFKVYLPLNDEVMVSSIISTHGGFNATTNDTLTVLVTNNGMSSQSNLPISYTLDNGTVVSETMTSLAAFTTDTFEFATTFDATIGGSHTIAVYTDLAADQDNSNDTSYLTFETSAQNDLSVIALISPITTICGATDTEVKVIVKNFGVLTQAPAGIEAIITDPSGSSVTLTGTTGSIASLATDTVVLGIVNTLTSGDYSVKAYSDLATDTIFNDNDTLNTTFEIFPILAVDYVESFDDNAFWASTSGWSTGASHGKSGKGLYKNFYGTGSNALGTAQMTRKIGPIPATGNLVFDYRLVEWTDYPDNAQELDADSFVFVISTDCGATFNMIHVVDSSNHVTTTDWAHVQVDLSAYAGQEAIIAVIGMRADGDYYFDLDNYGIAIPPTQIDLGIDTTICLNSGLEIDATSSVGSYYMWTADNDTLAFTGAVLTVDTAATYAVKVMAPAGTVYDTIVITTNDLPVVSMTDLDSNYCASDMPISLVGVPTGGMFTGMGVIGDSFDPFAAGAGNHEITYTYTDANGCVNYTMDTTLIDAAPVAVISGASDICEGSDIVLSATAMLAAPSVIFATYIEGSSNNKGLEIYNASVNTVNLDNYRIAQASNGNGWSYYHTFPAGATLAPNASWIMITDQVDATMFDATLADEVLAYPSLVHFNGDDARAIEYTTDGGSTWMMVDLIGDPDSDPGSGWDVAGVTAATKDHSLYRKENVTNGSLDWDVVAGTDSASSEYIVLPKNDFSALGNHIVTPDTINASFAWSNGETTSEITVMPTTTTTYSVTITVPNMDCGDVEEVTIVVNPMPVVDLGADQTIKWSNGSVNLNALNVGATYLWSTGETTQIVTYDNTNLTNSAPNTISVSVDLDGCVATDEVIITMEDDVSIGEAFENANVSIYPNPNNGQFDMTIEGVNGDLNMQIINVTGEVVYTESMNSAAKFTKSFDVSEFAAGVYYVRLSNNDGIVVKKLVIK